LSIRQAAAAEEEAEEEARGGFAHGLLQPTRFVVEKARGFILMLRSALNAGILERRYRNLRN